MFKRIFKIFLLILLLVVILALAFLIYFNWPVAESDTEANLGVTFSYRYAEEIGLNWQEAYLAVLDDLKVKRIRIPIYWDNVEGERDVYDFSKIDWQLQEAEKRGVEIILVIGQKVPRWPECFVPAWVENDEDRKKELLEFVETSLLRYKDWSVVNYWQIENEPLLKFGVCPNIDKDLLDQEIDLARSVAPEKEIVVTDSGELSLWLGAAKRADVFGTTMYREVVSEKFGSWSYPIGPRFFHFKRWLIETFIGQDQSIVIELQGEPWLSGWTTSFSLADQFSSMNEFKLEDNVKFAKKAGFSDIYLWGVEWWYWLKVEKNYAGLWEKAQIIFSENK